MKRFLPQSLSGQIAVVMTLALLAASAVNFLFLVGERSRAGLIEMSGPPMARFVDAASEIASRPSDRRGPPPGRRGRPPGSRLSVDDFSLASRERYEPHGQLERRLRQAFDDAEVRVEKVSAATRRVGDRPRDRIRDVLRRPGKRPAGREVALSARLEDGRWVNASFLMREPAGEDMLSLGASTLILFASVLTAALWISRRLSRPLRDLAEASAKVGSGDGGGDLPLSGPEDVRSAISAFNAMNRRVDALLREKDVMLGAIGHDLRTPLASIRIRLETMEPEAERLKAIATLEETAELLETILEFARQGRSAETPQKLDAAVLVEDLVEDYAETGAPVSLGESRRAPLECRPVLFRRMLRNLIDNAVAYGGAARLHVRPGPDQTEIAVEDEGPGMSEQEIAVAREPFVRTDASRNRSLGGAGLGLALADSICRSHGGRMDIVNRPTGGLSVRLILPTPKSGEGAPSQSED